jgi:hypothetical protein
VIEPTPWILNSSLVQSGTSARVRALAAVYYLLAELGRRARQEQVDQQRVTRAEVDRQPESIAGREEGQLVDEGLVSSEAPARTARWEA